MQHASVGQRAPVFAPPAFASLPRTQDQDRGKDDQQAKHKDHNYKVACTRHDFKRTGPKPRFTGVPTN
jgi:hypothetical protein